MADASPLVTFLLEQGTTASVVMACLWLLVKKVFAQYESRIEGLELKSTECENDRAQLHAQIFQIQKERIEQMNEFIAEKITSSSP